MGNELSHTLFRFSGFHASRLAQSYVTGANQIVYAAIATHQTLPSPCVILKAIRAGVGWVWLARLMGSCSGLGPLPNAWVLATPTCTACNFGMEAWTGEGMPIEI